MKRYYCRGGIVIYHGDSRDVLPRLAFDVVVTDPPYGTRWRQGVHRKRNSAPRRGIANDGDVSVRDAVLALTDTPAIVFGSFYAPFPRRLRQVLVWRKPNDAGVFGSVTGYRRDAEPVFLVGPWPRRTVRASSVLASARGSIGHIAREGRHPHSKPVDLLEQLIAMCPPGRIADPFMGTGATLLAARAAGRRAVGVELDERYCEIAATRLEAAAALERAAA